jgi:hypothetical protein
MLVPYLLHPRILIVDKPLILTPTISAIRRIVHFVLSHIGFLLLVQEEKVVLITLALLPFVLVDRVQVHF